MVAWARARAKGDGEGVCVSSVLMGWPAFQIVCKHCRLLFLMLLVLLLGLWLLLLVDD